MGGRGAIQTGADGQPHATQTLVVSGHALRRADPVAPKFKGGFSRPGLVEQPFDLFIRHSVPHPRIRKIPKMAAPLRHSAPDAIAAAFRTFFVTSSTAEKRNLLQSHRSAKLFVEVLYHYRRERKYLLHDFVVMPDHVHILITINRQITIERAVQFIKGGFSFRAAKELGFRSPVWQRGFSEVRIYDSEHFARLQEYIAHNPVKRGLAPNPAEYPYSSAGGGFELDEVPQGLKPYLSLRLVGTPEGVP